MKKMNEEVKREIDRAFKYSKLCMEIDDKIKEISGRLVADKIKATKENKPNEKE